MPALPTITALLESIPSGIGDALSVVLALICFAVFLLLIEVVRRI